MFSWQMVVRRADLRQTLWGGSSQSSVSRIWSSGPGPRKCCHFGNLGKRALGPGESHARNEPLGFCKLFYAVCCACPTLRFRKWVRKNKRGDVIDLSIAKASAKSNAQIFMCNRFRKDSITSQVTSYILRGNL